MNEKLNPNTNLLRTLVHMPSSRNGRRFAVVSGILSQMRIPHEAVFPFFRRTLLKGLEKEAAGSNYCSLRSRLPSSVNLLITDMQTTNARISANKTIHIDYGFKKYLGRPLPDDVLFLPILFHPNMLGLPYFETAARLARNKKREIKILFAGNCDPNTYENPHLSKEYDLLNRVELMRVIEQLPDNLKFFPKSKDAFETALACGELKNKFVWIDTSQFRLPQNEWLALLGKSQYFFCTPGVRYPYCQNLNEAMACGTVPVLQYADYYNPQLVDGLNCVTFKGEAGCSPEVQKLLTVQGPSIWSKRSKAAELYHHTYLGLEYAQSRIAEFIKNDSKSELTWVLAGKT